MSKLLIQEYPLQVLPSLAIKIGLNEAIFLQQLHYWLTPTAKYKPHYFEMDGMTRPWIYNTYHTKGKDKKTGWRVNFPFWSVRTIKRIVSNLKSQELIIVTDKFNAAASNRTLWYTIDYDKLADLETETPTSGTLDSDKLALSEGDKLALSRGGQVGTLMTETTTETISETTNSPNGENGTSNKQPIPQPTTTPEPTTNTNHTLSNKAASELLIFGKHPDSDTPNPNFDIIQEIQNAGWQIRDHIVEQAIVYYIEAARNQSSAFAVPNNKSVRSDWYKAVKGHLQDYRADQLKVMYPAAVDRLKERGMTFSRPGSLTKSLPDVAQETQAGDIVAWL